MINSVVFDLDGVLVSTDEMHFQAWLKLAGELGIDKFSREDNKRQRGVSRMESLEVVLEKGDRTYTQEEKDELADRKNNYYKESLETVDESIILPGAVDTLKMLNKRGIKVGIGSASRNTPAILEKTGLIKYIDEVSCGLDTQKSKPDPEVFLIAARKLKEACENCLVVEDSHAGIAAARAGNMKSLGVGPLYESLGATWCARTLADNINWDEIFA